MIQGVVLGGFSFSVKKVDFGGMYWSLSDIVLYVAVVAVIPDYLWNIYKMWMLRSHS